MSLEILNGKKGFSDDCDMSWNERTDCLSIINNIPSDSVCITYISNFIEATRVLSFGRKIQYIADLLSLSRVRILLPRVNKELFMYISEIPKEIEEHCKKRFGKKIIKRFLKGMWQ